MTSTDEQQKLAKLAEVISKMDIKNIKEKSFLDDLCVEIGKIQENEVSMISVPLPLVEVTSKDCIQANSEADEEFIMLNFEFSTSYDNELVKLLKNLCDENLESSEDKIQMMMVGESKKKIVETLFTFVCFSNYDPSNARLLAKLFKNIVGDLERDEIPKTALLSVLEHYRYYFVSKLIPTLPDDPNGYEKILNGLVIFLGNLVLEGVIDVDHVYPVIEIFLDDVFTEKEEFVEYGITLLNICGSLFHEAFFNHQLNAIERIKQNLSAATRNAAKAIAARASKLSSYRSLDETRMSQKLKIYWDLQASLKKVDTTSLSSYVENSQNITNLEVLNSIEGLVNNFISLTKQDMRELVVCLSEHNVEAKKISDLSKLVHKKDLALTQELDNFFYDSLCQVVKKYLFECQPVLYDDNMIKLFANKLKKFFSLLLDMFNSSLTTMDTVQICLKLVFESDIDQFVKVGAKFVKSLKYDDTVVKRWMKKMMLNEEKRNRILDLCKEEEQNTP